jgi:tartrate dehydratase beta subunit/fumarate hydratase class I family protein
MARDRRKNRLKKKMHAQEEHLDKVNGSKIYDPTPYQAVEEIQKNRGGKNMSKTDTAIKGIFEKHELRAGIAASKVLYAIRADVKNFEEFKDYVDTIADAAEQEEIGSDIVSNMYNQINLEILSLPAAEREDERHDVN